MGHPRDLASLLRSKPDGFPSLGFAATLKSRSLERQDETMVKAEASLDLNFFSRKCEAESG